jgi:hypothetical protein
VPADMLKPRQSQPSTMYIAIVLCLPRVIIAG